MTREEKERGEDPYGTSFCLKDRIRCNERSKVYEFNGYGKQLIKEVTTDIFFECGVQSCVWTDCLLDGTCSIPVKQARGVLSSLIKKGYIYPMGKGREAYIEFTPRGKEYLKNVVKI